MKRSILILAVVGFITLSHSPHLLGREDSRPIPLASHFSKKYTDDLSALIDKRYIRVLTTFNKTNFFISEGSFFGFEYALLKHEKVRWRRLSETLNLSSLHTDCLTICVK